MNPPPKSPSRLGGFTMMEIVVAVAVAAVLAILAFSGLQQATGQARQVRCLSNLRQIGALLQQFCLENRGYLPTSYRNSTRQYWFQQLADTARPEPENPLNPENSATIFACPASKRTWAVEKHKFHGNYAWNISYGNQWDESPGANPVKRYRLADLKIQEAALVADAAQGAYDIDSATHWFSHSGAVANSIDCRHHGAANVLFADSSVQWVPEYRLTADFLNPARHKAP